MSKFFYISLFAVLLGIPCIAQTTPSAEPPIWARHATAFDFSCGDKVEENLSPDKQFGVAVLCETRHDQDPTYSLRITKFGNTIFTDHLDLGAHELLWAPDSHSFFLNGGMSSYSGFFVVVYKIRSDDTVTRDTFTEKAQRDMVSAFPPCRAWNRDSVLCVQIAANPEFNMSGIRWTSDSSAIDVFAEIPCSSSYGGIMCQIRGYELAVPSGTIRRRFSTTQMQMQWRNSLNWEIHFVGRPKYGPAEVTFKHSTPEK